MATFEDIVNEPNSVLSTETPFYLVKVGGQTSWLSPNSLKLEPSSAFSNDDGRVYLIVKPEYEVDLRIRSESWQHFNLRDSIPDEIIESYDIRLSNPFWSVSGWQSSITVTMRGGSMLALAATGDEGKWDKQGSTFHQETEDRGITQPEDRFFKSGMLLSLTAPFENYWAGNSYSIYLPPKDNDLSVDILGYRSVGIENATVPTIGDVISDENTNEYVFADWSREYVIKKGVDCQGQAWEVRIVERQEDGMWFVLVDGTLGRSSNDYDEILSMARERVTSRQAESENCNVDEDPAGGGKMLLIGGVAVVGLLVLIILAKR